MKLFETLSFARIPVARTTFGNAVAVLSSRRPRPVDVHLVNAYTISLAHTEPDLLEVLQHAGVNLPDGKPLAILTRLTKNPLHQVRGPSLFEAILDSGRTSGIRHYFLGGSEETLIQLQSETRRRFPGLEVVGSFSPSFGTISSQEVAQQDSLISAAQPDIVWVGLGTPKQDFEAARIARELGITAIAVGAAFDFTAGTKSAPPRWTTRLGVEWLFRLATEPRRLWRRYTVGNAIFFWAFLRGLGR